MEWTDVSFDARLWLDTLGSFSPTVRAEARELKGRLPAEYGEDGTAYFNADDLRKIAESFNEAADWLDKRAAAAAPDA